MKNVIPAIIFAMMLLANTLVAQNLTLKGEILDQNTREPLMFANMTIGSQNKGTATDIDGKFALNIADEFFSDTLIITMIGYKTKSIPIKQLLDQKKQSSVKLLLAPTSFEFGVVEIGASIILEDVFFEFNKHKLLTESDTALNKLHNFLKRNPDYKIEISGHTDDVGDDEYNLALSEARAGAVVEWLEEAGIELSRMTVKGYGETMPIATNETELGRQQNRRVEFKVTEKQFNPSNPNNPNDANTADNNNNRSPVAPVQPSTKKTKPVGEEKGGEVVNQNDSDAPKTDNPTNQPKSKSAPKAIFAPKDDSDDADNQPKSPSAPKGLTAQSFKTQLEKHLEGKDFHGVVMFCENSLPTFQRVYGKANLTYGIDNQVGTRFYIGTLAEQFTAVIALQLLQNDQLALTDVIGKYIPSYPNNVYKNQITIGHLLSHTSGLVSESVVTIPLQQNKGKWQHEAFMANFANQQLLHSPGTQFLHSALNYYLMAVIIENILEKDFDTILKERIFDKAGMQQTRPFNLAILDKNRASNYQKNTTTGVITNAVITPEQVILGSTHLQSTIEDLQRWDAALRSHLLINEATTQILFNQNIANQSFFGAIHKNHQTKKSETIGNETYFSYSKEHTIIVISNVQNSGFEMGNW